MEHGTRPSFLVDGSYAWHQSDLQARVMRIGFSCLAAFSHADATPFCVFLRSNHCGAVTMHVACVVIEPAAKRSWLAICVPFVGPRPFCVAGSEIGTPDVFAHFGNSLA